jgi:selenocysteine-specific elongation factor
MIVATAGHVDHGKTLLVKALSGIDTDRLEEEKARGLTIELGFAYQQIDGDTTLGFVDVPGHIKFISNMLAGVGGIDHALLVIAADDGPMPQTREHLDILNLLGISGATIALTKIDRVDDHRIAEARNEIESLLAATSLRYAPIFPVSSTSGSGVPELNNHLIEQSRQLSIAPVTGSFRLAIDRCFNIKGSGLVVTGSVFSGQVKTGDELVVSPANLPVRVRGIRAQNKTVKEGRKGDRCAINLTGPGLNREMIHRGNWLLNADMHHPTNRIDAVINVLGTESKALKHWTPVHIHSAANHVTGHVAILESRTINPGESGLVQLAIDDSISICRGDKLIIRDQAASRTLGGGQVLDPFGPRRGRARAQRISLLNTLQQIELKAVLKDILQLEPEGTNLTNIAHSWNLDRAEQSELFGRIVYRQVQLASAGRDYIVGYDESAWTQLRTTIVKSLKQWHRDHLAEAGPAEKQLLQGIKPRPRLESFRAAIGELVQARLILKSVSALHLPGHSASLEPGEAKMWQRLEPIIRKEGLKPPVIHELASHSRIPVKELEKFLGRAIQLGLLVRVVKNRLFLPETVLELTQIARNVAMQSDQQCFTASEYRDATGIGRNLAIEVLEYFDRTGLTQRRGDKRILVPSD